MRDVSEWTFMGYGEKSTLGKEELLSPEGEEYLIKYPRESKVERENWEDVNEVIAAKIAEILNIKTIIAEIAKRNEKRGCLMVHFLKQYKAYHGEPGAPLFISEFTGKYEELKSSSLKSNELLEEGLKLLKGFSYFPLIKEEFLMMNIYDIMIGNQDRHPFNWQILFTEERNFFGPLYDNGASLGWQLPDSKLVDMLENQSKMNKFYKNTRLKCGLFEHTQPPIKINDVFSILSSSFPAEMKDISVRLEQFDEEAYNKYIDEMDLISSVRKEFLKEFIRFRRNKIIETIRKEEV